MNRFRTLLGVGLVVGFTCLGSARAFELKDGDSVVFMGSTVTNLSNYPDFLENFVRTRYPDLDLRFFTSGWPDEVAAAGLDRLQRDVLSLHPAPTVAVLNYGMYDGGIQPFDELRYKEFEDSLDKIISSLKATNCRVWLLTPLSIEEELNKALTEAHYNEVLRRYADGIHKLGKKHNVKVIDLYQLSIEGRLRHRQYDRRFNYHETRRLSPKPIVGKFVAAEVLKAWKAEPIATELMLDWKAKTAEITSGKAEVEVLDSNEWLLTLTDVTMPWPQITDPKERPAPYSPITALSHVVLRVNNCPGDGLLLGTVERGVPLLQMQLEEEGVDLTRFNPLHSHPNMDRLAKLVRHKNYIRSRRWWREVELRRIDQPELQAAQDAMVKAMEAYVLGYRDWINHLPRTIDVTLRLTAITPELIKARAPAKKPPPKTGPTSRGALERAAKTGVQTTPGAKPSAENKRAGGGKKKHE